MVIDPVLLLRTPVFWALIMGEYLYGGLFKALEMVFGIKWFGSGRLNEAFLVVVCSVCAASILIAPADAVSTPSLYDLAWSGWGRWLAVPFILKALLSGSGVVTNIVGLRCSHVLRFLGAFVGSLIWFWFVWKYVLVGEALALGFAFSIASGLFSLRIMVLSLMGLPTPGVLYGR